MPLIRQLWLLLFGTVLLAFVGGVVVNTLGARAAIEAQMRQRNNDNAAAYATVLSAQKGDAASMEAVLSAQYNTGFYRHIRLVTADGHVLFDREAPSQRFGAPAWFTALLPIASTPGRAQVTDRWRSVGMLEVVSHTASAEDELWTAAVRSAAALAAIGGLVAWLAALLIQRLRAPLDRVVLQAQKLVDGEYVIDDQPSAPELQRVTQAMNTMVRRVEANFDAQALQLDLLQRQANADPLTGLANRKHFMAQLAATLGREDGPAQSGLVLVRLRDLAEVNRDIGHAAADRMIGALAQALNTYPDRIAGCHVGRLNGADFALSIPVGGLAAETGCALAEALRAVLPNFGTGVSVSVGTVELPTRTPLSAVMATADGALAAAESAGAFAVESADLSDGDAGLTPSGGEASWRAALTDALGAQRARLVGFPLVTPSMQLVHLECPLRLQLDVHGDFEPAARWLPLALRTGMTAAADDRAIGLALLAIEADGLPRCVNLSAASLRDGGFVPRIRALLQDHPQTARLLSLEVPERAAVEHFDAVQGLGRQLRPTGVRFGIEHAGEQITRIDRLFEAGFDYVKLDASVGIGLAGDLHRSGFVQGIVAMLHGLAMQVYAEGIVADDDAQALWACSVDGVTGPWASARRCDLLV